MSVLDLIEARHIARVCHEANMAWRAANADYRYTPWDDLHRFQQQRMVEAVQEAIAEPDRTPEQQHDIWVKAKAKEGWVYGEVLNEAAKVSPNMAVFVDLSPAEQAKDRLFLAIIRALSEPRKEPPSEIG